MLTILRARNAGGDAGEALPVVFSRLENATAKIRRGQVTLVAAAPGVGKSVFALRLLVGLQKPSLYFSADTNNFTMCIRMAAMVTNHHVQDVENQYDMNHGAYYDGHLEAFQHVRFNFTQYITPSLIEAELTAFALAYGEFPTILVIDNVRNLHIDEGGEKQYDKALDWLDELSKEFGIAVIALHHLTGAYDDGNVVPPLSALQEKVSKQAALVLNLYRKGNPDNPSMGVAIVKNRTGQCDASGGFEVVLDYAPERMQLSG